MLSQKDAEVSQLKKSTRTTDPVRLIFSVWSMVVLFCIGLAKIKTFNESVNRANQIILSHVVFKFGGEQTALAPINPLHKA